MKLSFPLPPPPAFSFPIPFLLIPPFSPFFSLPLSRSPSLPRRGTTVVRTARRHHLSNFHLSLHLFAFFLFFPLFSFFPCLSSFLPFVEGDGGLEEDRGWKKKEERRRNLNLIHFGTAAERKEGEGKGGRGRRGKKKSNSNIAW